jgi:hypothetical protein
VARLTDDLAFAVPDSALLTTHWLEARARLPQTTEALEVVRTAMDALTQALNYPRTAIATSITPNDPTSHNETSTTPRIGAIGRQTAELLTSSPITDEIREHVRKVVIDAKKLAASLAAKDEFDNFDVVGAESEETTAWKKTWMLQASNEARRIEDSMRTLTSRVILANDGEQAATSRRR